jgi:peroxiredoxin
LKFPCMVKVPPCYSSERKNLIWFLPVLLVVFWTSPGRADSSSARLQRSGVGNFVLIDHEGKSRELYHQTEARAVVLIFTTTGCPIVQKSVTRIKALRDEFGSKGVVFWLVNSNTDDDANSIREEARDFGIDLPILMDRSQVVARALNASRTAEAVCIRPKTWTVFYRGAIDDQFGYGTEKQRASHNYLENALSSFLAGKKVSPARTEVKGCRIQFEPQEKK